jgi:hypothetical protein
VVPHPAPRLWFFYFEWTALPVPGSVKLAGKG